MAKSRKVSSISKEFDGKEVQGKLIERSGLLGSKVSKEVFKMPGGGKHIEKTRTNKKGDVVSRLSRDTKVNPLKLFNDNKEKAIKKAGGEMSAYKKSLKKAQYGIAAGPLERIESKKLDNLYGPNTPMILSPETMNNLVDTRNTVETNVRENKPYFNSGRWNSVENAVKEGRVKETELKKGGSVKRKKK
jgi:hypothetical protein